MGFFQFLTQKNPKTIANHNINKKTKKIKTNKQTNINMKIINKKKISKNKDNKNEYPQIKKYTSCNTKHN